MAAPDSAKQVFSGCVLAESSPEPCYLWSSCDSVHFGFLFPTQECVLKGIQPVELTLKGSSESGTCDGNAL